MLDCFQWACALPSLCTNVCISCDYFITRIKFSVNNLEKACNFLHVQCNDLHILPKYISNLIENIG